jgi:hypothetical protein
VHTNLLDFIAIIILDEKHKLFIVKPYGEPQVWVRRAYAATSLT